MAAGAGDAAAAGDAAEETTWEVAAAATVFEDDGPKAAAAAVYEDDGPEAAAVATAYEDDGPEAAIKAASNDESGITEDHLPQQGANAFYLTTYGLVQNPDGSIELRDVPLSGGKDFRSSYSDGSVLYVSVNLKYSGENIERVDFFTDDGFFAKQYLKIENGNVVEEPRAMSHSDPSNAENALITMYGYDFDAIGSSFTLYKDSVTDDYLLFLGTEINGNNDWRIAPPQMTVRAVATFNDGTTQEEMYALDLTNDIGMGVIQHSPEEQERWRVEFEKYSNLLNNIPLAQCEVVPGSVRHLKYGDTYEYKDGMDDVIGTASFAISEESIKSAIDQGLFDENGIFIIGSKLYDLHGVGGFGDSDGSDGNNVNDGSDGSDGSNGSDGFIAVIINNYDGTFTGMVYTVPWKMIIESVKK
ncbi:MAG: hypothetical protein FWH01_01285 [Oscillospiraceae bacterium]|nr:hypothetical protein [Oscillospiraceae bacterium]